MKKQKQAEVQASADRAHTRIKTITTVMAKVSVSEKTAKVLDRRRQHLHTAIKILSKGST